MATAPSAISTHNTTGGAEFVTRPKHLRLVARDGTLTIDGVPVGPLFGGTAPGLDFLALLGVLGYTPNEYVAICTEDKRNGKPFGREAIVQAHHAPGVIDELADIDIYFGVNPIAEQVLSNGGRGKTEDVTRLAALPADLDFKDNGCRDEATAHGIIDDLSAVLGTRPSAITNSGGGLHVYWPVREGHINDDNREQVTLLLKRWGRLVKATAKAHGANADSVFDLPRVLRVPGTFNCKHDPIPVICHADTGRPLTLAQVDAQLSEFVVGGENVNVGTPRSNPDDWQYANETCSYATEMIRGWNGDVPESGRHQWLLSQSVRLACAVRLGCITEADHRHGYEVLADRMRQLREATDESVPQREFVKAFAFGPEMAATKTDGQARAELGGHEHHDQLIDDEPFWSSRPVLSDLRQFARARRVGPWATLGYVLARVVGAIPPTVVLPPLVGSHASLNLFVALVGPSGAGKGGASGAAADWLTTDPAAFTATLGSGEGMAKMFAYKHRINGRIGPWVQEGLRASVLFDAPEVDNLIALTTRSSSTLLPQLRSAYSGEELGFSYADPAKAVRLCAHRYRLCLTVGVQPGRGKALLDDADGGTPQRFVWLPTDDVQAPDELPELPAGRDLQRWPDSAVGRLVSGVAPAAVLDTPVTDAALRVLGVPDAAREAIDSHRVAMLRGGTVDPLDGHRLLCRLKVAAALMWLDGRTDEVSDDDWSLAGIVMAISDRTRCGVVDVLRSKAHAENASRGRAEGLREIARTELVRNEQAERVQRVADNIERKLKENGGELARGALRKMIHLRDRPLFDDAEAVLTETGHVDKLPSDNCGPGGFVLRLAGEGVSK